MHKNIKLQYSFQ